MSKERELQEAIKLIKEMMPIVDPEEDFNTIVIAEEHIAASEARKRKELDEAHGNLKALSRILDAARTSSTRPRSVPSAEAHAAALNELDANRLSLAKAISDYEGLLANKEGEYTALKEEARRLEESDPALDHEKELDGTALKLRIFQGLGFTVVPHEDRPRKLLVRAESNDVHPVTLSANDANGDETNRLWDLASS
ncbi:hypothetical protein HGRIS_013229 [Hohenbuehelia grisea]|uniref:Kinetochore protein Spc24 n=1 Tax=Hohenbuehelia grisea TaxID=104357 RepID=A0ABR3IUY9_9AGAR